MKRLAFVLFSVMLMLLASFAGADAKIGVVTTIPDLADMARNIGGDLLEIKSLATGVEDIHVDEPPATKHLVASATVRDAQGNEDTPDGQPTRVRNVTVRRYHAPPIEGDGRNVDVRGDIGGLVFEEVRVDGQSIGWPAR